MLNGFHILTLTGSLRGGETAGNTFFVYIIVFADKSTPCRHQSDRQQEDYTGQNHSDHN